MSGRYWVWCPIWKLPTIPNQHPCNSPDIDFQDSRRSRQGPPQQQMPWALEWSRSHCCISRISHAVRLADTYNPCLSCRRHIYTSNGTSAITSSIHFAKDSSINEGAGRTNTQYQSLPFTSSTLMINSIYIYNLYRSYNTIFPSFMAIAISQIFPKLCCKPRCFRGWQSLQLGYQGIDIHRHAAWKNGKSFWPFELTAAMTTSRIGSRVLQYFVFGETLIPENAHRFIQLNYRFQMVSTWKKFFWSFMSPTDLGTSGCNAISRTETAGTQTWRIQL